MGDVFISYRRDDSRSATGRLADRLQAAFGADRVFRDIGSIAPGADFEAALRRAIEGATVLLAVVGPRWLSVVDADGRRRIDDPSDLVRREIESAMTAGRAVIPLLVDGARMPAPAELPPALAAFGRMQALVLDDARWTHDCESLIEALRRHGVEPGPGAGARPMHPIAGLPVDLLELVVRPKRLMRRLAGGGGVEPLLRALRLWFAAVLLGALLVGSVLADGLVSWVFHSLLIGAFVSGLLGSVVAVGWRVGGTRTGWQQAAAGAACLLGGASMLAAAGLLPIALGQAMADPLIFDRVRAFARQSPLPYDELLALAARPPSGPALAGAALGFLLWAGAGVWLVAAWNGLRIAYGATWAAAVRAALAAGAIAWALVALPRWAAGSG